MNTLHPPMHDLRNRSMRPAKRRSSSGLIELTDVESELTARPPFKILIVEDDLNVASLLKEMIELEGRFQVTDVASDLAGTVSAIDANQPDLALIDINLSGNATGIEIAAKAQDAGIATLFSTGYPLPFPVPEIALGCLCKPYSCYTVLQSIRVVEQIIRGFTAELEVPLELELY